MSHAAANLLADAEKLGDAAWTAKLRELIAAWEKRLRPGSVPCRYCGNPTGTWLMSTCRDCIHGD